ncbi:hypothetical protein HME9302_02394 [Alteripontixanthobacter maritimus]|uniref:Uncharacterized protein n=1 Tax=Alteripontixanthobacter maritimus TaxID=2161824 RepID=A0A369QC76_9SPHN|nr:hypothetical protein [Alteripontixanthobacter maritimus]RDC61175.1 hypothetical protein HME9302_02394 [Alteripontixanthobacter maritimus]
MTIEHRLQTEWRAGNKLKAAGDPSPVASAPRHPKGAGEPGLDQSPGPGFA